MAKDCFCGCGRTIPRFPLGIRSINTRGRQVVERLSWAEDHGGRDEPELAWWFDNGEAIVAELAGAMHGDVDPRVLDERRAREWQAVGRDLLRNQRRGELEAKAGFGRALRESGLSTEDAARALGVGMTDRGMSVDEAIDALRRGELRP